MSFETDKNAVWLLRLVWTAAAATAAGIGTVMGLRVFYVPWLWVIGAAVWTAGWFWYLPRLCRRFRGVYDGKTVRTQSGALWQKETIVPLSSLRTFEVWIPPLHSLFGCRTVVLRFAGGSAWLPLMDAQTARRLTALLEKQGEDN